MDARHKVIKRAHLNFQLSYITKATFRVFEIYVVRVYNKIVYVQVNQFFFVLLIHVEKSIYVSLFHRQNYKEAVGIEKSIQMNILAITSNNSNNGFFYNSNLVWSVIWYISLYMKLGLFVSVSCKIQTQEAYWHVSWTQNNNRTSVYTYVLHKHLDIL